MREPLRQRGHEVVTPELPLGDADLTWVQRAAGAAAAVRAAPAGVLVVGHSLATAYAPLAAAARPGTGVVHLCPAPVGLLARRLAVKPYRHGFLFPAEDADGVSRWEPAAAAAALYPRLPPATAAVFAARLRPDTRPPDPYPLTAHPPGPRALVHASDDELFDPAWERAAAREVLGVEPVALSGGHFPMLERPEELAALLDRLARTAAA